MMAKSKIENDFLKSLSSREYFEQIVEPAFENAIKQGLKPDNYMYMFSKNGYDYFKNKISKQYVKYKSDVVQICVLKSMFG